MPNARHGAVKRIRGNIDFVSDFHKVTWSREIRNTLVTGQWDVLNAVTKVENTSVSEEELILGRREGSWRICRV